MKTRRGPKRPRATQRTTLSSDDIERAALAMVERDGLAQLSMRKLGAAVGVEAMSLYHHYPSKAHLMDALLGRLLREIEVPGPPLPPRERLRRGCIAYRAMALRHPELAQFVLVHRMNTAEGVSFLERVVQPIAEAGLDNETAARMFRVLGYYLMGAILDETAGYAKGPSAAEPLPLDEQAKLAPTLIGMSPYFKPEHWEATFLLGLDLVLDRIWPPLVRRARS